MPMTVQWGVEWFEAELSLSRHCSRLGNVKEIAGT
jgi:hypothetical protein